MDTINTSTANRGPSQGKLHKRGQWRLAFPLTCALLFGAHSATAQSVELVKDINVGKADASPEDVVRFDGRMFFQADDGVNGAELWASDGTEDGTTLIKDINPGIRGSNPHGFTVYDNRLYFAGISDTPKLIRGKS